MTRHSFWNTAPVTRLLYLLLLGGSCTDYRASPEPTKTKYTDLPKATPSSAPKMQSVATPSEATPVVESLSPRRAEMPNDGTIESAMARFLNSLARRDTKGFIKCFSQKKTFSYVGTIEKPYQTDVGSYSELARDLATKDTNAGWYSVLFDGGPDDAFSRYVDNSKGEQWKRVGKNKFVPPDNSAESRVFVIWRKEQGRWFVDAIGEPGA